MRTLTGILLAVLMALPLTAAARTTRGETTFGPKVGYVSRNSSVDAGLVFQYSLSSVVRISPEIGIIFRHKDLDALTADINVHFPFRFAEGHAAVYPLIGAAFTSWGRHNPDHINNDDITTHSNQFGLNAGAGLELYCTSSLKLSFEAKYTLMRHYPTAYVNASIAFVF